MRYVVIVYKSRQHSVRSSVFCHYDRSILINDFDCISKCSTFINLLFASIFSIKIGSGVPQGSVLVPLLFILSINNVLIGIILLQSAESVIVQNNNLWLLIYLRKYHSIIYFIYCNNLNYHRATTNFFRGLN